MLAMILLFSTLLRLLFLQDIQRHSENQPETFKNDSDKLPLAKLANEYFDNQLSTQGANHGRLFLFRTIEYVLLTVPFMLILLEQLK